MYTLYSDAGGQLLLTLYRILGDFFLCSMFIYQFLKLEICLLEGIRERSVEQSISIGRIFTGDFPPDQPGIFNVGQA